MIKALCIFLIAISSMSANAATIALGGHFNAGYTSGWVDGVNNNYNPALLDDTGLQYGDPLNFSAPVIYPWPLTISLNTPNYGELTVVLTTADYLDYTPAGEFFQLQGTINGGGWAILDVNLPYYVSSSFGLMGQFTAMPPAPPVLPPVVTPPIVCCDSPPVTPIPPIINPPIPPTPPHAVPETPTLWMLAAGFAALAYIAMRKRAAQKDLSNARN